MPISRSIEGRATTAPRCAPRLDQAGGGELAHRLAHRRARHAEAARDVGLVERGARRQRAAHDLVGKLQAQFLGARDLHPDGDARSIRRTTASARGAAVGREVVEAHAVQTFGSSMMLTWAATIRQPSGKRTQVCICRPTLPGSVSR